MRKQLAIASVIALLMVGVGGLGWTRLTTYLDTSLGQPTAVDLVVDPGATLRPILRDLADRGVLKRPDWLYVWARLSDRTAIRAGDYEILGEDTPRTLLAKLRDGRVRTAKLTIVPGQNRWQIRATLAGEGWVDAATFDRLCDDRALLAAHGLVDAPSCEGYLFAETYVFARGIAAREIFAAAYGLTRTLLATLTASGRGPMRFSDHQLLTLASIVEKETGATDERPRIACLFYNRLMAKPPWRLDTDPTVIYAATLADPHFDGNLQSWHLHELKHPYNTYTTAGLPPGPIASPSRAAIAAVLAPATCHDFFFVARNDGTHEFCPTLACHATAVQRWQVDFFKSRPRPAPP